MTPSTPQPPTHRHTRAVYAGSFDPFTVGHHDIVTRALEIVDEVYVLIGINPKKIPFLTVEERLEQIREVYRHQPRVTAFSYEGLTGKFALEHEANLLVRGIRNVTDMEFERNMAEFNKVHFGLETILLLSSPELCTVSSSLVRELASFGEEFSQYLP